MIQTIPLTSFSFETATCSLSVTGQVAAISQLSEQLILKRLRFQLQIRSDAQPFTPTTDSVTEPAPILVTIAGQTAQLALLQDQLQGYLQTYLQARTLESAIAAPAQIEASPLFQPLGLTRHRLEVVRLQPQPPVDWVELSSLQLSDLMETLSQMAGTIRVLPEDLATATRTRHHRSLWLGSAAAAVVAAILGVKLINPMAPIPVFETAEQPTSQPAPAVQKQTPPAAESDQQEAPTAPEPEASPPELGQGSAPPATPESATGAGSPQPTANTDSAAQNLSPTTPTPADQKAGQPPTPAARSTPLPAAVPPAPDPATAVSPRATEEAAPPAATINTPAPDSTAAGRSTSAYSSTPSVAAPATPESLSQAADSSQPSRAPIQVRWQDELAASFAQSWPFSAPLPAAISYEVEIAADGRLQRLTPLTELAKTLQNQLQFPTLGQMVTAPIPTGAQRAYLHFSPHGDLTVTPVPITDPPVEP